MKPGLSKQNIIGMVFFLIMFLAGASRVWAQAGEPVRVIPLSESGYERANALAFSSDGNYLAVGGTSGIYVFEFQKLSAPEFIQTNSWARSLVFLPNRNTVAAGLFDHTIKLWNVPGARQVSQMEGPQDWVRSISVSADGSLIASASDDDTLRVWSASDGAPLLVIDENATGIRAVALSPDGSLVAGALGDKTVRIWSVPDGTLLHTLSGHTDWVRCLAFSPDGSLLASGSFDTTIRLWNPADGSEVRTLKGHTSSVLSVAFSPDGKTLASGSVDETVRLWQVDSGDLLQMLAGHTDFVYAVGFSPDGRSLASGGGDNSLRIWDLEALAGLEAAPATPQKASSSDCRACHHTRGQLGPARVIELSCEECHQGGASLSWCSAFPQAEGIEPILAAYHPVREAAGLPVNNRKIAVEIASPGNGETLYVKGDYQVPHKIIGRVYYAGDEPVSKVKVQLDIFTDGQLFNSLTLYPADNGQFSFGVVINPDKKPPEFIAPVPGIPSCRVCHDRAFSMPGLPHGNVTLVVTATAPDGEQASDERWLRVDSSGKAPVSVQVVDDVTGKAIPDLIVHTSTVLYGWRARTSDTPSDEAGNVRLDLESLSNRSTEYRITIPSQIVSGQLYTSDDSANLTLEPGKSAYPALTLTAHAQTGRIEGRVSGGELPTSVEDMQVWAVRYPAGPVYTVPLARDGSFAFEDLPIDEYHLYAAPVALARLGQHGSDQDVDLLESPQALVSISLTKGRQIAGRVSAQNGALLPFAWITAGEHARAVPLSTSTGEYLISDLPDGAVYLTVSAPGYYSLSLPIQAEGNNLDFQLVPRPDARVIPWGDGTLTLAPETSAVVDGFDVDLEYGWLWGRGGQSQPLNIHTPQADLEITGNEFALESPVGGTAWLFLNEGQAKVIIKNHTDSITVNSGEMLALEPGAKPISMNRDVEYGFHPSLEEAPIREVIEPSLRAQLEDRLVKAGIDAARGVTFITYSLLFVILFGIPLFALFRYRRSRLRSS